MTIVYLVGHINKLKDRMDANIINCFDYIAENSAYNSDYNVKYYEINCIKNLEYNTSDIFILLPNAFDKETISESRDIIKNMTNHKCLFFEDLKCKCGYKCNGTASECEWKKWYDKNIVPYMKGFYWYHFVGIVIGVIGVSELLWIGKNSFFVLLNNLYRY
jgi:hypothetical protein